MSDNQLPIHIDPVRLAQRSQRLGGQYALGEMQRLATALVHTEGNVRVALAFGIDEAGTRYLEGEVETEVTLVCQRCLQPMRYPIHARMVLGVVGSADEGENLSEEYEPLVCESESLFLRDVIEDELILALPIVARHAEVECPATARVGAGQESTADEPQRANPFAVLAALKTNSKA